MHLHSWGPFPSSLILPSCLLPLKQSSKQNKVSDIAEDDVEFLRFLLARPELLVCTIPGLRCAGSRPQGFVDIC